MPHNIIWITTWYLLITSSCINGNYDNVEYGEDDTPVVFPDMEEIPENRCVAYDGTAGSCRPAGLCVFRFDTVRHLEDSACTMDDGEVGICCPGKPPPTRGTGPVRPEDPAMPDITSVDLDTAGEEGRSIVQRIDQLEVELQRRGLIASKNSPEYFLEVQFGGNKSKVWKIGRNGLTGVEATLKLVRTFQLSWAQSREGLRHFSLAKTVISDTCPKATPCPTTKYRTSDGTCNNLEHPEWGKAFHTYLRILPPRYADGINEARTSYDGGPLPSAREVSQRICPDEDHPSRRLTVAFTVWAQFLAYDLSLTAVTHAGNGESILCCHPAIDKNPRLLHPACMPIHIPTNDPFYKPIGKSCMQFLRSIAAPRPDCTFGSREQLNQVTAYLDGSFIYGSSENQTNHLRSFKDGKMKYILTSNGEIIPPTGENIPCSAFRRRYNCFDTGDVRSNQNVLLSLIYGIWLRQHNRLADRLSRLNPGWNDEILFHEARRIVNAQIQHITYTEFLPLLLGNKVMSSYRLVPKLSGYSFDYDPKLNAAIFNSFATAANRYGHTLVQENVEMFSSNLGEIRVLDKSFDPSLLHRDNAIDALVRGMLRRPAQAFDKYVAHNLTNRLFETLNIDDGLDLVALTIQRGRDHGLAGYNEWREYCGLPRVKNFEDLATVVDPLSARNFSRLYRNVDDVDLYPAGITENPLPDAILGPTFACIIAEQFRRLKHGDRFWYENGGMESSFNEAQLAEIRKTTFSRILCDNVKVEELQVVAFIRTARWNPLQRCRSELIPRMDLGAWKNEPVWT